MTGLVFVLLTFLTLILSVIFCHIASSMLHLASFGRNCRLFCSISFLIDLCFSPG